MWAWLAGIELATFPSPVDGKARLLDIYLIRTKSALD
jgi:hypothetical protein